MNMNFNDNDPRNSLEKIAQLISNFILLCLFTAIFGFVISFIATDEFIKGEWFGIATMSLMIFLTFISLIFSMTSKEDWEDCKREAEKMLKEYEEEKQKRKKEDESRTDENQ